MDLYFQSCNHTLARGHTPIAISSPWGECIHIMNAANRTTGNANFVHQVAYIYIYTLK